MQQDPLGAEMWIKGTRWGVLLTLLFFVGAALVFAPLRLLGAGVAVSLFAAIILGPLLGTLAFVWAWGRRKKD